MPVASILVKELGPGAPGALAAAGAPLVPLAGAPAAGAVAAAGVAPAAPPLAGSAAAPPAGAFAGGVFAASGFSRSEKSLTTLAFMIESPRRMVTPPENTEMRCLPSS